MDGIILVYGASWCPDCRRAKRFLGDPAVSVGAAAAIAIRQYLDRQERA